MSTTTAARGQPQCMNRLIMRTFHIMKPYPYRHPSSVITQNAIITRTIVTPGHRNKTISSYCCGFFCLNNAARCGTIASRMNFYIYI